MMQQPKILQVIPTLHTGGAERTAVDIGDAIVAHGWTSIVASQGGRLLDQLTQGGNQHVMLPLKSKNPITIWRNAGRLAQLIEQENIALIHARSRAPAWSALLAARRTGIPFVTTYHGSYNQKSRLKAWYNSVMARGDVVIANSGWTRDLIIGRNPWAAERIVVVHRGTDFEQFNLDTVTQERCDTLRRQWSISDSETVLVQLGRLTPGKGHKFLIDAVAEIIVEFPKLRVLLVGDALGSKEYKDELEAKIAHHGLQDSVVMTGHCSDPAAALAVADLVVGATVQPEAFGRTTIEAGALERPVIVSDIGAVGETVLAAADVPENQTTGWKVPAADVESLAIALRQALSMSPEKRSEIGKRARKHALENFSLQQMCDKTIAIYEKLLMDSGANRSPKV